jgi:hypothetical protein
MASPMWTSVFDSSPGGDSRFADHAHVEGWAGEMRVNLVRLASLIAFYAYHLVNVFSSPNDSGISGPYHFKVTVLVMVWAIGSLVLYFWLSLGWTPPLLKYAVTVWDLLLVSTLLILSGGPKSSFVPLFFRVIAAAPLRLSLPLVYVTTVGSVAAYLFLLGHYVFYVVGADRYYSESALRIPRAQEVAVVLGLLIAGILAGQVVRQIERLLRNSIDATKDPDRRSAASNEAMHDATWIGVGVLILGVLVLIGLIFCFTSVSGSTGSNDVIPAVVGCVAFAVAVAAGLLALFNSGGRTENRGAQP